MVLHYKTKRGDKDKDKYKYKYKYMCKDKDKDKNKDKDKDKDKVKDKDKDKAIKTSRTRGGISTSAAVKAFSPCCIFACSTNNNKNDWWR